MVFLDSFDHYVTGQGPKWTRSAAIFAGIGRHGSAGGVADGLFNIWEKTLGDSLSAPATVYAGVAIYGSPGNNTPLQFTNTHYSLSVGMQPMGDGRFVMVANGVQGTAVTPPILQGCFFYLEMTATVTTTSISVTFRINDRDVLTDSYTFPTPIVPNPLFPFGWTLFRIAGPGGGNSISIDDVYLNDYAFFGDVNIEALRPIAPNTSQWVPNPVVANWQNVDEATPDGTSTTVKSVWRDDLDLYTMTQLPAGLTIRATQGGVCSKVDSSQTGPAFKMQYGSGGGAILSDEFYPNPLAFLYSFDGRNDVASTSVALNGIPFGYIETQLPVHP